MQHQLLQHSLQQSRLLLEGNLKGLITIKDIEKQIKYPFSAKDEQGRLLCGAAVGITANCLDRVEALVKSHVDVVVMDSAHGHSANVLRTVRMVKDAYPDLQVVAGNVATGRSSKGIDRGRSRCRESRYRTWIDLYNPYRCRYRCTAGYGSYGLLCCGKRVRNPDHCRWRYQVFRRYDKAIAAGANVCMMGSIFAG